MNRRLGIPDFSQTAALQWADGPVTSEICGVQMGKSIQAIQPPVWGFHTTMTKWGLRVDCLAAHGCLAASLPTLLTLPTLLLFISGLLPHLCR